MSAKSNTLASASEKSPEELMAELGVNSSGLDSREAKRRLAKYGEHVVFEHSEANVISTLFSKLKNPFVIILFLASTASFILGERTSALIIVVIVAAGVLLDFFNSYRASKAIEKLRERVAPTATLIRNGKKQEIPFRNIVPGDLVFLSAGDVVPADCRLIEAEDMFVDQSAITGESFPQEKEPVTLQNAATKNPAELANILLMGTNVVTGYGTAIVINTGAKTEFGKIASRLREPRPQTAFERGAKNFSFLLLRLTIVFVSFIFLANWLLGRDVLESFIFATAIAVSLTPELLPVIFAVTLSKGSINMAKKDVVVKNLPFIQNFGNMNLLCTDKTGTLTEGRITLVKHVDGLGNDSEEVMRWASLSSKYHTGIKTPLEEAIREYKTYDTSGYAKIDEIPFDFTRKRDGIVVEKNKERTLIVKGAPEEIFNVTKYYALGSKLNAFDDKERPRITATFERLSSDGYRTLAIAIRKVGIKQKYVKEDEAELTLLGFVAFRDPPKSTAGKAITALRNLGIDIKVITGDHELVSRKTCEEIGLEVKGVLNGPELERLDDATLAKRVSEITIFSRIAPAEKERIIRSLKRAGYIVGYLGDGINDAPALRAADVGISVNNAVDVAREVADIILLKKSLTVLKDGVVEGRKAFQNTFKYITMGLSSDLGNTISMAFAALFLPFLPMLPPQILLNDLLYDATQLALPLDRVDDEAVERPPSWDIELIKKFIIHFGPASSLFDLLTFGLFLVVFHLTEGQFQTGWFMESIATQTLVIHIVRTQKLPIFESRASAPLFFATIAAVAAGWLLPFTRLGSLLHFMPLPAALITSIIFIVAAYLVTVELLKRRFWKRHA